MATKEQCEYYDQCRFVSWRADHVNGQANQLPADGDCGKSNPEECARVKGDVSVAYYGPYTREEMEISFPLIPNDNGRPAKRLQGGGNR